MSPFIKGNALVERLGSHHLPIAAIGPKWSFWPSKSLSQKEFH
jgi:hypothetical protein